MKDRNLEEIYFQHDERRGIIWYDDSAMVWNVEYKGKNIGTISFSDMPEVIYTTPEDWLTEKAIAILVS